MLKFEIITIFPEIFKSYFQEGMLGRAIRNEAIGIKIHNLRDYSDDKRRTVDDTPYGGGAGMVMKIEPISKCVNDIRSKDPGIVEKTRIILFSAKGKKFTQKDALRLGRYEKLVFICGRYEGIDERVAKKIADEEISIGEYILTGGELPAMILVDSITRLLPGVLGNPDSLLEESFSSKGNKEKSSSFLEYPQYSKPENFNGWKVPKVLLSGNHAKIAEWRKKHSK